jgi:hypothetical protein
MENGSLVLVNGFELSGGGACPKLAAAISHRTARPVNTNRLLLITYTSAMSLSERNPIS